MKYKTLRERRLPVWLRENPHVWWALCLIPILLCYFIPEQLVTEGYHLTQCAFDARIPFLPGFIWFYVLWFVLLAGMGLWLLHRDGRGFREYMLFLTVGYFVCAVIYLCWPNGQELRPANLEIRSVETWMLSILYGFDSNTDVLPSLHVLGSLGVACSACLTPSIRSRWVKAGISALCVPVAVSTVFIKQHAIMDVAAGVIVGFALYALVHRILKNE